jgi:ADP-ribose pyrophosphatase YjhB (NUDIX family)
VHGLAREVKEELGVEAEVRETPILLATHRYGPEGGYVLAIGFRATIGNQDPNPTDDVAEVRWVSIEELDSLDFAWEHDREMVRLVLEEDEKYT